jgi:hypothetical protein
MVINPSTPFTLQPRHVALLPIVKVNGLVPVFELASKKTSSTEVGAVAPLAPPEEADQLVVDELVHVPVPPTQYLFAISWLAEH